LVFIERARVAAELGERAVRPLDPLPGSGLAVACELYRQSVQWALLAHRAARHERAEASEPLSDLWRELDPALLSRAAGGEQRLARLRSDLDGRSFVDFAELSETRQRELADAARDFSRALLEALEPERRRKERVWFRRALFATCGIVALIVLFLVARAVALALEARRDLAAGASWTSSSRHYQGGCASPRQDCPGGENYFFHTIQENDPWLIVDLGKVRRTGSVVVKNRVDCCPERAVPLVVELSTDQKNWTVVATRTSPFDVWRASYEQTRARYVKLHVPRPDGILHLKSVRVLP
jgi:hypothetical protein